MCLSSHLQRGVAQPGSAPGLGPGGRRFESCRPDKKENPMGSLFLFIHLSVRYTIVADEIFGVMDCA